MESTSDAKQNTSRCTSSARIPISPTRYIKPAVLTLSVWQEIYSIVIARDIDIHTTIMASTTMEVGKEAHVVAILGCGKSVLYMWWRGIH
jgi:hypothetical protein